jgi:GNAT superfamily N-acetyltransferase
VPPLVSERLEALDPARGIFYRDAEVALFLAREGRNVLGTIAAFVDHARVRHLGAPVGGFGFFEVLERYDAAAALLDACRAWLRERGMASVRGPTSFGDNDSPGVLIAGADCPPAMLEAHTPPYYKDFLERYGMQKESDGYAWRASFERVDAELRNASSDIVRVAEAARKDATLSIRSIRLEDWDREVATIRALFNATTSHIPGSVPIGEEDFGRLAGQMRPFLDPELGLIAEIGGEPVGYCLLIPDLNQVLARLNGRLLPFHWMRVKRYIRDIDVVSFKLLGVLKEYRRRGIDALLYVEALTKAKERGYRWLDGSLTSELNPGINLIARSRGAELYKHYRLYRMAV